MSTLPWHAHIERAAQDCDGLYERTNIEHPLDDEDEDDFRSRVYRMCLPHNSDLVDPNGRGFGVEVVFTTNRFHWAAPTDDGFRSVEVAFCDGPCGGDKPTFRDHTAEKAGY